MESYQLNTYCIPAYTTPKIISAKAIANELFIEERILCFVTGYYLKPFIQNAFRLIDCTMGGENAHKNFLSEAIPTAAYLDTSNLLVDKTSKYPNTFPTKEQVVDAMQNLGVKIDDNIVLYCQNHMVTSMTRVYTILSSYGFKAVSILDGGIFAYKKLGYPVAPGVDYTGPKSEITDIVDPTPHLMKMEEIVEFAKGKKSNMQLIDLRDSESFNGRDPSPFSGCRQGHVPGAINIPASLFVNEDDTFKKYSECIQIFESNGVKWNKDIVVMCKTGVSATVGYMALTFIGHQGMKLYDGSWSEYGSNDTPSSPVVPEYPMYFHSGMAPTPQYYVVPSGDYYMALQGDKDHYPVYYK